MENISALTKLKIIAFKDPEFKKFRGVYLAAMNPTTYSESLQTDYKNEVVPGKSGGPLQFNKTVNPTLSLDFLFDRTGALNESLSTGSDYGVGIAADILLFKNVVYDFMGDVHEPNYLQILWGTLNFTGRLTDLDIQYKLFAPNGKPLRAVASATFRHEDPPGLLDKIENRMSPDLTHIRTVNAGETLPLMCYDIYGDSKYYLEVAKVNKISAFRKLEVGQQIIFPPLQKQS